MESLISVLNLSKGFKTKLKEEGLKGSFKALFKPEYKVIKAVDSISFDIKKGEIVAFIGPNGAGKSTTLKILSGILYADSGKCVVDGLNSQKDRKKLAYKIGTVFGQKPQLWFHLPAIDSFRLFASIYDLKKKDYEPRMYELFDLFEINDIITQPVRKLSLGQRMRCEVALALLHKPEILFLDEPTIGLDVVVKKNLRELIKKINKEEKVTVILTSHDMGDVEDICKRAIIINKGKIIYDDLLDNIKKKYLGVKLITIITEDFVKEIKKKGVKLIKKNKFSMSIEVDTKLMSMKNLIEEITEQNSIKDITIEETPIEEIISKIFKE